MPNALQITAPDADNPLAQAPRQPFAPWSQFDKDADPLPGAAAPTPGMSQLDLWLAQQRAKNNAQGYEPLPGITSGAAPKPWGLDRSQLPQRPQPQPYQSGFIANTLNRVRPYDLSIDPGMSMWSDRAGHIFKIPHGGTGYTPPLPDLQQQPPPRPQDIFGSPYSSEFNYQSWREPYSDQQT